MPKRRTRGHVPPEGAPLGSVWIELGGGVFTLVDATDAPVLAQHVWHPGSRGYASTRIGEHVVLLHRLIVPTIDEVDHRNGNRLDNRRCNLRAVTRAQNAANRRKSVNNSSGFKGVSRYRGKWGARLGVGGERIFLGVFETREEAAAAYDRAARKHHGEFAAVNLEDS